METLCRLSYWGEPQTRVSTARTGEKIRSGPAEKGPEVTPMPYQVLTTVILGLHFAFVAYVVLGGFLAWRWPRAIWPHLLAAAWGLAIVAGRVDCPLTWAEDWSRQRAGSCTPST